jgi:ABC-type glycerol-3-phosphate transport system substrate-binding protein
MTDNDSDTVSRRTILRGAGVGAGVALAGCAGGGGGGGGGGGDGTDTETATPTETQAMAGGGGGSGEGILHWDAGLPSDEQELEQTISTLKEFFSDRTGSQVEITDFTYEDLRSGYLTGARSGDPDSAEGVLSHLTEYARAGLIEPITDEAQSLEWFDGYVDSTIDAMRYDGDIYALPYTGNGRAFIYRLDIFEELGQEPPETADEFLEIGRMIDSETDIVPFHNCTKDGGVRAFQEWMSHVYQHTDNLYVQEGDGWVVNIEAETLGLIFEKFYYEVWASDNPIANPDQLGTGWQVNDPEYINGNVAMIECGPWIRNWTSGPEISDSDAATDILDNKTAVAQLPYAEGGSPGTYLEVKPVMVNSNSDSKDLAFDMVATRCAPEVMNSMSEIDPGGNITPVHEDVESTLENENWQTFTEVFRSGRALAKIAWGPVRQEFYPEMQNVAYGEKDPYTAGEDLHSALADLESEL